jgi:hypothetical protein
MLNVLTGALVGGFFNVACYVLVQLARRKKVSWKEALGSFLGGATAGALAGASFGASLMAGGAFKATGFLAADGALSSAVETTTDNLLEKAPVLQGVAHDAVIGAVEAPLFFGVTKGLAKALPGLAPALEGDDQEGDDPAGGDSSETVKERVSTAVKKVGRAAVQYVKDGPGRRHSVLDVALASQFQGWGGQLLQGVSGYWLSVPDFWGSNGGAHPSSEGSNAKPEPSSPAKGITGTLAEN